MHYIGIDHHRQYSFLTVMDGDGQVVKQGKVLNYRLDMEDFIRDITGSIQAVIEAGRSSMSMVDVLEDIGIDVKVAHPAEVKAIAHAKIKTDKRDSKILAELLRADLIPEVHKKGKDSREAQRVLRQRVFFVGMMTRVKNRIRALLAQQVEQVNKSVGGFNDLFSLKGIEHLKSLELPSSDRALLNAMLELFAQLKILIKESDKLVDAIFQQNRDAQRIATVPGYGKFFSVLIASEIDQIERFDSAAKLQSYAGIIPSTNNSGTRCYHGKIIKACNRWIRWAAVEAVWPAIRSDAELRIYYQKRAFRKNSNTAKVATARRMLSIIYKILKEKRCYVSFQDKIKHRLPS